MTFIGVLLPTISSSFRRCLSLRRVLLPYRATRDCMSVRKVLCHALRRVVARVALILAIKFSVSLSTVALGGLSGVPRQCRWTSAKGVFPPTLQLDANLTVASVGVRSWSQFPWLCRGQEPSLSHSSFQ